MALSKYDIVIIGAGLFGLSSACHLKMENPDVKILVVEKFKSYAQGNTGKSAAGFRDLFSTEVNFKLATSSIKFYDHIQKDSNFDIGMKRVGYMFLMSENKLRSTDIVDRLSKKTRIRVMERDEISKITSFNTNLDKTEAEILRLDPIEVGVIGENCGILDIEKLTTYYYQESVKMGVDFSFDTEVLDFSLEPLSPLNYPGEPFLWQGKRIAKIETSKGEIVGETFVIATGAWANILLDKIGIDSHIRPKKRQVFQVSGAKIKKMVLDPEFSINDTGVFPFTVLPSHGIYLRPVPGNGSFWISTSGTTSDAEVGSDFAYSSNYDVEDDVVADTYFDNHISHTLRAYLNSFDSFKLTSKWVGYYSLNTQDKTPYIFKTLNAIIAVGGSGAGVMKGDSIGRIVSALYADREQAKLYNGSELSVDALGPKERNVGIEQFRF